MSTEEFNKKLGAQIRFARLGAALTQVELARELHVGPKYISTLEHGRKQPSLKLLLQLATLAQMDLQLSFHI